MLKRGITLGELIAASITILSCLIGFYVSTNVRLSVIEQKQIQYDRNFERFEAKLDKIGEQTESIRLELKDKASRK
jgi:hypothetical protein